MLKMNVRKFLRSLNFRIMVFLILIGIIPALLVAGGFLAAYDRLSITQLGNDVRNQCQILATQLSSASYFENMDNQTLEGEMTQLAAPITFTSNRQVAPSPSPAIFFASSVFT